MLAVRGVVLFVALAKLVRSKSIPVTGLTTGFQQGTGTPPARHNINQLESESGPTWYVVQQHLNHIQY